MRIRHALHVTLLGSFALLPGGAVRATPVAPLHWVNPARCLSPCSYASESLVHIATDGCIAKNGPLRLAAEAQPALEAWLREARDAGMRIEVASAYRSYDEQAATFMQAMEVGRAARPGHSEHQLGTAVDLRYEGGVPTEAWLAGTAARHGFVLSYPRGKERITGYRAEPWHFRFVGRAMARTVGGRTLEEVFAANPAIAPPEGRCDTCASPLSYARCDGVDARGRCDGTLLSWCFQGALARLDCASSDERCSSQDGLAACRAP